MNNFLASIMHTKGYNRINNNTLELFGNDNEFFLIKDFDIGEIQDFFKTEKLNFLISEFQRLDNEKIKKNTSLFVLIKVDDIHRFYKQYLNTIVIIEEDDYYFRKYIIFYTEEGLQKLNPDINYLLQFIQDNDNYLDEEGLFDKFEKNMFFDDAYFIAMQLIIKLPFVTLPHSGDHFVVIDDRIKSRIKASELVKREQQVDQILGLLDGGNITEQLDNSDILDNLRQILED